MENTDQLLKIVVGSRFGDRPSQHLDSIRQERYERAQSVSKVVNLKDSDRVLEIGSGCGWTARTLAPQVFEYLVSDVSHDFLKMAAEETQGLPNIQLYHMPYGDFEKFKHLEINIILALDVFTQFSFYDFAVYLKEVFITLAQGGRFYFNFMNAQFLNIAVDEKFLRHERLFLNDPTKEHLLLHWMEPQTIERMICDIGFRIHSKHLTLDHSWYLLEKEVSA